MKSRILLLALFITAHCGGIAQINYDFASIPEKLKENAHIIKRYENNTFEVKDIDRAVYRVHKVYTILDSEGDWRLNFQEHTSKLRKIDEFEIRQYDSQGKVRQRFKKNDLNKQAVLDGLATDGMIHYMRLLTTGYPVTIEFKYEVEYSGTESYPSYIIQDIDESVQASTFTAKVPVDIDLRFKAQKTDLKPSVGTEGQFKVYKWEVKDLQAYKDEEHTVHGRFFFPSIILAPNKFRHYNTYGDMSTWKSFGKWGYDLMQGLDDLPEDKRFFFSTMVQNEKTDRDKVRLIYEYLQKNFRYVSIQLGIGGVRPFAAKITDEKKYGDCKALSFYMYAALKSVGIKSYCAWVNAYYNSEPVAADFPCDRFDHEILCVPLKGDTVWLECTSNDAEFGVLGPFTENRNALLLTETGGVLVSTPASRSEHNMMNSSTTVLLSEDGSGKVTSIIGGRGSYKERTNTIIAAKRDEQKVMIVNDLGFKQPDEFSVAKSQKEERPGMDISLSIEKIPQFVAGSKMFLSPRVSQLWSYKLPPSEGRRYDFYFPFPFERTDTTVYQLPADYIAEVLPKTASLQCEYAEYSTNYIYDKERNQVVCTATFRLKKHIVPAQKYAAVKTFFDNLMSDESQKLIVKKG